MNIISIYYPNKKIHVIKYGDGGDDEITYLLIAIANNKKSYLIDTYSIGKDVYENIKLLLNLLGKDSVIYSRLIKALEKLENSKNKYHPSRKVTKKICDMLGSKFYRYFSVERYENRFRHIIFDERNVFRNKADVIYSRLQFIILFIH